VTQQLGRFWTSTCFNDSHWFRTNLGLRSVSLESLWNSRSTHIKNVQTDSICDWGIIFSECCSWTTNWARTCVALGLHLDSNRISLRPPSWHGKPCWTPSSLHAPLMDICIGAMSSSVSFRLESVVPLFVHQSWPCLGMATGRGEAEGMLPVPTRPPIPDPCPGPNNPIRGKRTRSSSPADPRTPTGPRGVKHPTKKIANQK
jgi:hypothetical protein